LIWAIRPSEASAVAPYWDPTTGLKQRQFGGKFLKMEPVPVRGFCSPAPYKEFLLLSYVKPIEKYLAFEPRTETK
jgi:hypothetical protein